MFLGVIHFMQSAKRIEILFFQSKQGVQGLHLLIRSFLVSSL